MTKADITHPSDDESSDEEISDVSVEEVEETVEEKRARSTARRAELKQRLVDLQREAADVKLEVKLDVTASCLRIKKTLADNGTYTAFADAVYCIIDRYANQCPLWCYFTIDVEAINKVMGVGTYQPDDQEIATLMRRLVIDLGKNGVVANLRGSSWESPALVVYHPDATPHVSAVVQHNYDKLIARRTADIEKIKERDETRTERIASRIAKRREARAAKKVSALQEAVEKDAVSVVEDEETHVPPSQITWVDEAGVPLNPQPEGFGICEVDGLLDVVEMPSDATASDTAVDEFQVLTVTDA